LIGAASSCGHRRGILLQRQLKSRIIRGSDSPGYGAPHQDSPIRHHESLQPICPHRRPASAGAGARLCRRSTTSCATRGRARSRAHGGRESSDHRAHPSRASSDGSLLPLPRSAGPAGLRKRSGSTQRRCGAVAHHGSGRNPRRAVRSAARHTPGLARTHRQRARSRMENCRGHQPRASRDRAIYAHERVRTRTSRKGKRARRRRAPLPRST
jgi:hypothetical protein